MWVRAKGPWVWIVPSSIQSSTDYKASLVFWVQRTSWGLLFCFFAELKEECSEIWRWKLAKFAVDLVSFSRNILRHQNQIHGQCSFRFPYFCGETDFTWFLDIFCNVLPSIAKCRASFPCCSLKNQIHHCDLRHCYSGVWSQSDLDPAWLGSMNSDFPNSGNFWETLGD